jgi:hypothetical protein
MFELHVAGAWGIAPAIYQRFWGVAPGTHRYTVVEHALAELEGPAIVAESRCH